MKRNIFEILVSLLWGTAAYMLYVQILSVVSTKTVETFGVLKHVPVGVGAFNLRLMVYYAVLIFHDTLIGLPLFIMFGMVLGLSISKYHFSRPLLLCAGFFLTQFYYLFIRFNFGYAIPAYVVVIRAALIALLLVFFTRLGCTIKRKWEDQASE